MTQFPQINRWFDGFKSNDSTENHKQKQDLNLLPVCFVWQVILLFVQVLLST